MATNSLKSKPNELIDKLIDAQQNVDERNEILALIRFVRRGMTASEISDANVLAAQKTVAHLQQLVSAGEIVRVLRDGIQWYELPHQEFRGKLQNYSAPLHQRSASPATNLILTPRGEQFGEV